MRSIGLRLDGSAAGLWIGLFVGIALTAPVGAAPQLRAAFALNPAGSAMLLRTSESRRVCGPPPRAPVLGFEHASAQLRTPIQRLGKLPSLKSSEKPGDPVPEPVAEVDSAAVLAAQRVKDEKLWAAVPPLNPSPKKNGPSPKAQTPEP